MRQRFPQLDPRFRPLVIQLIDRLDLLGVRYVITDTLRSLSTQQAAFKRGATKCDGVTKVSKHQLGLAIDICAMNEGDGPSWDYKQYAEVYRTIGNFARDLGMECGQDWKPIDKTTGFGWDVPHYEYKGAVA
jgi:hypothetical protein